jgi:hypothetical protein
MFDGTNRLLVSWSQCRLLEGTRIVPCTSDRMNNTTTPPVAAPPLYGVYVYDVRNNTQQPVVAPQEGFIFTEVVAGSGRALPPVILDRAAGVDFDDNLLTESVGVLHIRSVYDVDGVDTAPGGIATVRNPANAGYATRPARFLRIEKAVSQPDDDLRDVADTAFGPNRALGMRDILGYAPVEPDGSVMVKVPANVAFNISVLDANGRRLGGVIGGRHTNWLQVKPGEQLECNGCHNPTPIPPATARSHGRSGLFNSINAGAPTTGQPFPNTNPALFADMGETMAEVRNRVMCSGACEPSVNVVFDDYWLSTFNPAAGFDMCFVAGASGVRSDPANSAARHTCTTALTTTLPTTSNCSSDWNSNCRVTIHYERHIHPLWNVSRTDVDGDGNPDMVGGLPVDRRCNGCHTPVGAANAAQVPPGQLDLTDGPSDDEAEHFRAYRELLFTDNLQTLNAGTGMLEDVCAQVDPQTQVCLAFATVAPPMSAAGANASTRFFSTFSTAGGTVDHRGFLTPAELKLLSEWLDIGAQYYNDPFVAPEN